MKAMIDKGSLLCPTFCGVTGERIEDLDLHVGLGAHFDPASTGVHPTVITLHGYKFDFTSNSIPQMDDTLCVIVTPIDSGVKPIKELELNCDTSSMFYHISRLAYKKFHEEGKRIKTCATCEFFDGGGLEDDGSWKEQNGDCHNRHSPRFQTSVNGTCEHYFRDSDLVDGSLRTATRKF